MTALYRQFPSLQECQTYCDEQTELAGFPSGSATQAWDAPHQLSDGSYVTTAFNDPSAMPWHPSWGTPLQISIAPQDPNIILQEQAQARFTALMAGGLTINSTSTPEINGTYAVDAGAQADFSAVQVYVLTHNTFPLGVVQPWPLMNGQTVMISSTALFTAIATAAAQFVAALSITQPIAAAGGVAAWPSPSVTIP